MPSQRGSRCSCICTWLSSEVGSPLRTRSWQLGEIYIERLLTLAEANAGLWDVITSPNDVPSQTVVSVGTDLLEYFKRFVAAFLYTDTMMPDITWAPIVAFSHVLRPGDTVLTFNSETRLSGGF